MSSTVYPSLLKYYLYSQCFNVVGTVSSASEISKVELNLIPPIIKFHRHGTNKGFNPCSGLVIRCPESPMNIFVIKNLNKIPVYDYSVII